MSCPCILKLLMNRTFVSDSNDQITVLLIQYQYLAFIGTASVVLIVTMLASSEVYHVFYRNDSFRLFQLFSSENSLLKIAGHCQNRSKVTILNGGVDGFSYFSLISVILFSNQDHPQFQAWSGKNQRVLIRHAVMCQIQTVIFRHVHIHLQLLALCVICWRNNQLLLITKKKKRQNNTVISYCDIGVKNNNIR